MSQPFARHICTLHCFLLSLYAAFWFVIIWESNESTMGLLLGISFEECVIPERNKSASTASSGESIRTANGANRFIENGGDEDGVGDQLLNNMGLSSSILRSWVVIASLDAFDHKISLMIL